MIETYPDQMEIILTPYTTKTKMVTDEAGLWAALKKHDVGWFGIKPFASGSLGRSALRTCSGMASPILPDEMLHADRRLSGR